MRARCGADLTFIIITIVATMPALAFEDVPSGLAVKIDPALARTDTERDSICKSIGGALLVGGGALGTGNFDSLSCSGEERPWLLEIAPEGDTIRFNLSLRLAAQKHLQATVPVPQPRNGRLAEHTRFKRTVQLLALALLDQLPMLARPNPKIEGAKDPFLAKSPKALGLAPLEVAWPLVAVRLGFQPELGIWNVKIVREPSEAVTASSIWYASASGPTTLQGEILAQLNLSPQNADARLAKKKEASAPKSLPQEPKSPPLKLLSFRLTPPSSLWLGIDLSLLQAPADGLPMTVVADVRFGSHSDYWRWVHLVCRKQAWVYSVSYTPDEVLAEEAGLDPATLPEQNITSLLFDDQWLGLGTRYGLDLGSLFRLNQELAIGITLHEIALLDEVPVDFNFQSSQDVTAPFVSYQASLAFLLGRVFTEAYAEFGALAPYFQQYQSLQAGLKTFFVFGIPEASETGSQPSFILKAGPQAAARAVSLDRSFPASDRGKEDSVRTQVELTTFSFGLGLYAAY